MDETIDAAAAHKAFIQRQQALLERLEEYERTPYHTEEERYIYERGLKIYRDNQSVLLYARREGYEERRKEGIEDVARKLKTMGMELAQIAQATGLPIETIEKL